MKIIRLGLVLMFLVTPAMAQHAGFRTAGFTSPVTPFVTAPVQPFGVVPVVPMQVAPVRVGPIVTQPVVGGYPTLPHSTGMHPAYIPGNAYYPQYGSGYYPVYQPVYVVQPQVIVPGTVIVPGAIVVPSTVIVTRPASVGHFRAGPPTLESTRDRAIREFGQPVTSVWSNGIETLTFRNGVTVTIPNGQVGSPR